MTKGVVFKSLSKLSEYLNQIYQQTRLRCTIRLYVLATDIDFGITEANGQIEFKLPASEITTRLTNPDDETWCSHLRLYRIAHLLYRKHVEVEAFLRHRDCPENYCRSKYAL